MGAVPYCFNLSLGLPKKISKKWLHSFSSKILKLQKKYKFFLLGGDIAETKAAKLAVGSHSKNVVMSSTKSMTGHLLGAAGGVEAIFSTLSIKDQVAPPTINIFNQDPQCDLDYAANEAKEISINNAISNSFGFGGTNGSIVISKLT